MTNTSHSDLPTAQRLILRSLRVGKWILRIIWLVILLGIAESIIATWLISKRLDLTGTPLGWIFQNLLLVILSGICLSLLTIFVWVVYSFLERDTSWLYSAEERQRRIRRQKFAEHIEDIIRRLDRNEGWEDERFADLEIEIKPEDHHRVFTHLPFSKRRRSSPWSERSLSKALESSQDELILLEGEPGSGKSVALRHVVREMAEMAKRSPDLKSIPIYVNLKGLDRAPDDAIDYNLIKWFVLKSSNPMNDPNIDQFLANEFDRVDGTWFFIFDSFDELPDVLGSTEVDDVVRHYEEAINAFLHGMNRCRGIVASRQFHGRDYLSGLGWSTFRILPLSSEERRRELIRRSDLAPKLARKLVGQLGNAKEADILEMASNPLFLALLCEYMKSGEPFPSNTHAVFETYIENRLKRDKGGLQRRYSLDTRLIRETAENIAFCMSADTSIGLSPTRGDLKDALVRQQMTVPGDFDTLLDALESTKLAQSSDETAADGPGRPFTFVHRRFQEYFATCVVLREMERITPKELLTNARWRETAVVLCQTLPADELAPLRKQAKLLLTQFGNAISDLIVDPLDYVRKQEQDATSRRVASAPHADSLAWGANQSSPRSDQEQQTLRGFSWPSGMFHLLSILQEGFHSHLTDLPEEVTKPIGSLVLSATEQRSLPNRMWALEVAGAAPEPILVYLLNRAFADPSLRLKEVAYQQTTYLRSDLPSAIARTIRHALVGFSLTGRLRREHDTIEVYLAHLPESSSEGFLSIMRLLFWLPMLDLIWLGILFFCSLLPFFFQIPHNVKNIPPLEVVGVVTTYCFFLFGLLSISYAAIWGIHKLAQQHYLSYHKFWRLFWRLFCLMSVVGILLASLGGLLGGPGVVISLLIAVQTLLLVPFALIAAETGTIIFRPIKSWLPWILVPLWQVIWLIFYLLSRLPSLIASLFRKETYMPFASLFRKETYMPFVRGLLLSAVKVVLGFAILAGALAILAGALVVFGFVMSNPFLAKVFYIIGGLLILFDIIYILSVIRSSNENIHQIFVEAIHQIFVEPRQHRKHWEAFIKDAPGEVTCREWWEKIEKYNLYTLASEEKVIRSTREKSLLAATEETENFINFLEEETEAKLEQKKYESSLNSGITWLDIQSADYKQFLENTNDYVLHELRLLLEDVHSRRQRRAYEQP